MKTIKKYKKILWGIEHRKNCLLKSDTTTGFELFQTKADAQCAIDWSSIEGKPVKVLITIERAGIYG